MEMERGIIVCLLALAAILAVTKGDSCPLAPTGSVSIGRVTDRNNVMSLLKSTFNGWCQMTKHRKLNNMLASANRLSDNMRRKALAQGTRKSVSTRRKISTG